MLLPPALGLALLAAAPLAHAADWPNWRGPTRDGISTETDWTAHWPAGGPRQLWQLNVGLGCSTIHVSQGRAFTLGNKDERDTVYGLDAVTGRILWQHSYPCPLMAKYWEGGTLATPTVDGERVYSLSKMGDLFCLQAATGQVLWQKSLTKDLGGQLPTWGYAGSPLVVKDWVLLDAGGPGAATVALDKLTGATVWKNGDDPAGYGTLQLFTFQGRECLASFNGFGLVVRELNGGKEIARFPWKTKYDVNATTPIVSGDRIFISSGYGHGCALLQLSADGLKAVWQNTGMKNHFNSCVLWQGQLYGFDENTLACLDLATGQVRWTQAGLGKASLILADGKLIILAEKGDLVIAEASPQAFKELARAKVLGGKCWVVPVLANGRLYVKNNGGDAACLDLRGK